MILSDKIEVYDEFNDECILRVKDIKQFIKEETKLIKDMLEIFIPERKWNLFIDKRNKIAGDELIK